VAPSLVDGHQPRVRDRYNQLSPLANRYPCADGRWVVLNMPEPHWWPRFCSAIGDEALGADPEFDSPKKRFDRGPELVERIDAIMSTRTVEEWGQIFDDAGLIWAPIQTAAQTVTDPQVRAIGAFVEVEHPADGTKFETLASPIRIVGSSIGPERGAPTLGADTDAVLAELGMTPDDVAALRADGSIGD
jgi:crotonobetainyl-CoA:carnitine CoA-transferase CaiB-like acyl-CoA transferase